MSEFFLKPELKKFVRTKMLAGFNCELARRLASLDAGDYVDPVNARARLRRRSQKHRQSRS